MKGGRPFPALPPVLFSLLLVFLISSAAFSTVCEIPCDSSCPRSNTSEPVCEPISFSAEAAIQKQLLLSGEETNSTLTVLNSENMSIACVYSIWGTDRLDPVSVGEFGSAAIGSETIVAPSGNPGYQQVVPVNYAVRCESRIVNATGGTYLWCGAGCIEFSSFYQYPTVEEVREYQERKLVASNAMSQALLALGEARKLIEKVQFSLNLVAPDFDTSFAEYRLSQAEALAEEALYAYGSASYSFDQALFENASYFAGIAASVAGEARAFANEAYSSLVYYSPTSRSYLDWYVNTTGIMIGELEEILNNLEPIAEAAPEVLGGAFAEWVADLEDAKGLLKDAREMLDRGRDEEALGLLQKASALLLKLKQSIERTFDKVYSELLKVAINSHRLATQSKEAFEALVNGTTSIRGVNSNDFYGIQQNFGRAESFLDRAAENIAAAENSTVQSQMRREVNLALIRVANARVEIAIAIGKYRLATFKTETLVAALSVLAALISIGILLNDLRRKKRVEALAQVKGEALGVGEGERETEKAPEQRGKRRRELPRVSERY